MFDRRESLKVNFRGSVGNLQASDDFSSLRKGMAPVETLLSSVNIMQTQDEIEFKSLKVKLEQARQDIQILMQVKYEQELLIHKLKGENQKLKSLLVYNLSSHSSPPTFSSQVPSPNFLENMSKRVCLSMPKSQEKLNDYIQKSRCNKEFEVGVNLVMEKNPIPNHQTNIQIFDAQYSEYEEDEGEDEFQPRRNVSHSICRHFLKGRCRYKATCRFSHEVGHCPYCHEELPANRVTSSAHLGRCWKIVEQQSLSSNLCLNYTDQDHYNTFHS